MKQVFNIFSLYMKCAGEKPLDRALLPWKHRASHWLSPEFRTRNWLIWGFKSIYDDNGIENVKKGFMRKTTTLHVHHTVWYISLPKMHNNERYSRWRHLFILMCQLEAHWVLETKDSIVLLVTNLNTKTNVSKQWRLLLPNVTFRGGSL